MDEGGRMNTTLYIDGRQVLLENVVCKGQEAAFALAGRSYRFSGYRLPGGGFLLEREIAAGVWQRMEAAVWQAGRERRVRVGNREAKVAAQPARVESASGQAELSPVAPMPGLIRRILVKAGDKVAQGQAMMVMEAMKLQIALSAGDNATVEAILVREGEMVGEGAELVRLRRQEKKK
jgi:biotin carboxyl carrier protein